MQNRFKPSKDSKLPYSQFLGKPTFTEVAISSYDPLDSPFLRNAPKAIFGQLPDMSKTKSFYRGDSKPLGVVLQEGGFIASGPNLDLFSHAFPVDGFSVKNSAYVSTSFSKQVATRFPSGSVAEFPQPFYTTLSPNSAVSYLYEVMPRETPIYVAKQLSPLVRQGKIYIEDFAILAQERERAFVGKIKSSDIKGYWEVHISKIQIDDPAMYSKFLDKEFIEECCFEYQRKVSPEFISNPSYKAPLLPKVIQGVKIGSKVLNGIGLTIDGFNLYDAYRESEKLQDYSPVIVEGTRIASAWGGAAAVGIPAAKACASIAPPWGAIGCGLAGSAVGYYGGSHLGSSLGPSIVAGVEKTKWVLETTIKESAATIHAAQHIVIEKGAKIADKVVRGAGKSLNIAATIFFANQKSAEHTRKLLAQGVEPLAAKTCGAVGGVTETASTHVGNVAVFGGSTVLASTGIPGCLAGAAFFLEGTKMVEKQSHEIGGITETACLKLFGSSSAKPLIGRPREVEQQFQDLRKLNFMNSHKY